MISVILTYSCKNLILILGSVQFHNFPFSNELLEYWRCKKADCSLSLKLFISDQVKEVSDDFESNTWKECGLAL